MAAIGFMQREIQDAAYRYQREVEDRARIVVGVNEFVTDEPPPANLFQLDPGVGEALAERLARLRAHAATAAGRRALDALEAGARGRDNLMPLLVDAVEAVGHAGRDLRAAARGLRRAPALGDLLRRAARAWPSLAGAAG